MALRSIKYPTPKSLIEEFRSRKLEAVIVDGLIKQAWIVLFAFLALLYALLSHFAGKYSPSIRAYLEPRLSWAFFAAYIAFVIGLFFYYSSTDRGRRSRLMRLLYLLRQYDRFNHRKEMEVVSRIHPRTSTAALVFLLTSLLAAPLGIAIIYLFGVAIISDITNNIKGTHINPSFGPKLFFNGYGIVLSLSFVWIVHLFESARLESLLLSAKYRHKMIASWRARIVKLRLKIRRQPARIASAQNTSASA